MKELSRQSAIEQFGLRYEPSLKNTDLSLHQPTDLTGKLLKAAATHVSSIIIVNEALGTASRSFHFTSVEDAAKKLIEERRNHYMAQKEKLRDMMQAPEAQAALQSALTQPVTPDHIPLAKAFQTAAQTIEKIDQVLAAGFTLEVTPLKPTLKVPDPILNVGDQAFVIHETNKTPAITPVTIAAREISDFTFGTTADISATYTYKLGTADQTADISTAPKMPGIVATGDKQLVFTDKGLAQAAFSKIVSEKLDRLDAERAALTKALRQQKIPRQKPAM